jgi:hypothetical protein
MPTLESRIDELYKGLPADFVAARSALAKTLTGDEARQVKALAKPTVVPWAVNQVYWHARDVYGRLTKAGEKLREAQLAALKGRTADVRGATVAHRQAIGDAVKTAARLASAGGAHPDPEQLARMFEAVSLQKELPEAHGRFTQPLQPQGFEALAGVAIKVSPPAHSEKQSRAGAHADVPRAPSKTALAEENRRREREEAAAARRRQEAIEKAEAAVARARSAEADAREAWDRSKLRLDEAEKALRDARAGQA